MICPVCKGEKFYEYDIGVGWLDCLEADARGLELVPDARGLECKNCGHKIFSLLKPKSFSDCDKEEASTQCKST